MQARISDVKTWMKQNKLKLNDDIGIHVSNKKTIKPATVLYGDVAQ